VIFATVGTMLPFDRFVRGVDNWAQANPGIPVFVQIGDGKYVPQHAKWQRFISQSEFKERLNACKLFVAHVGVGSILQALEAHKQMLLLARLASLREHTTEHQLHTANKFRDVAGIVIADDVVILHREMTRLIENPISGSKLGSEYAPPEMTDKIREFVMFGISVTGVS
jgi:UDP-N-acetylglucosamine transferase subunit ALG13